MISMDPSIIRRMAENKKRIDHREFNKYRDITIEKNVITSAEGSARVRIGNTEVVAGVKIGTGEPFSDRPNEGVMMVNAEFVPLASEDFESGPPGEDSIETSRVVDRAIRESKIIDLEKLCITPGEKVWMVFIDIDVLDDDGNLIDASSLAAIAALSEAKLPKLDEDGKVIYGEKTDQPLPLKGKALSTTVVKIGDTLLVDPTQLEEDAMDARLTVGTFRDEEGTKLCSMQKGGSSSFSLEEIEKIIQIAVEKGDELREKV